MCVEEEGAGYGEGRGGGLRYLCSQGGFHVGVS